MSQPMPIDKMCVLQLFSSPREQGEVFKFTEPSSSFEFWFTCFKKDRSRSSVHRIRILLSRGDVRERTVKTQGGRNLRKKATEMPSFNEEHSEEMDYAIWRMHQKGCDPRTIASKLRESELYVSRKYINFALKRGVVLERRMSQHAMVIEQNDVIDNVMQDNSEPEEVEEISVEANHVPLEEAGISMAGNDPHLVSQQIEISAAESDSEDDAMEELVGVSSDKKHRRIKTTDDLIRRLEDDFKIYPDTKVKERAAKFGIAVGTLCQIKHNILKMPKESGRTWKSTPQMVEDIAADMQVQPHMKVKDRAKKFGISVGTLCRIMHDILEMPKRQVQRSGDRRPRKLKEATSVAAALSPWTLKAVREEASRLALSKVGLPRKPKKLARDYVPLPRSDSIPKQGVSVSQMQLRADHGGQVVFLTYDPSSASHLAGESSATTIPISIASLPGSDELVWVVNPISTEAAAAAAEANASDGSSETKAEPTASDPAVADADVQIVETASESKEE